MPDDIQRTIYKLEIDDSGYIRGIESLNNSTKKLTAEQERTNQVLKTNEAALKTQSEFLQQTKKDLDSYTGTNERYRQQLQKSFKDAQADNLKLTELVNNNRKAYEQAQKAAQDFANISARATSLQQQTTGGKIPTTAPTGISTPIADVSGLPEIILESKNEFDQLRVAIGLAEERMNALNKEDEEFKNLAPIVKQGKDALLQYDNAAKLSGESTLSLRTQITKGREELVRLEEAGKGTSQEYITLEKNVAKLTNAFEDQRNRIKVLASETRLLDFGKAAIQSAISGFQVYTSVAVLAGGASEELQKKTLQLFAAMQLLTSLEQLAAQVKRGGVIATNLQSAAQAVYTSVVGASTGALKAFRIALLGTGIGAAAVAIGFLISKLGLFSSETNEVAERQKLLNRVNEDAVKGYANEVSKLDIIKTKLNDLSIPQNKRIQLAKEYNKTAEVANKLDLKQIDNIDLINAAIDRQIQKLEERAIARAAEAVIGEKAESFFRAQVELEEKFPLFSDQRIKELDKNAERIVNIRKKALGSDAAIDIQELLALSGLSDDQLKQVAANDKKYEILLDEKTRIDLANIAKQKENIEKARSGETISGTLVASAQADLEKKKIEFQRALDAVGGLINIEGLFTDTKGDKIENVFLQKLKELQARLAAATAKSFESEGTIRKQFAASLEKEFADIDLLLKKNQLTSPQASFLKAITENINETELNTALNLFRDKQVEALRKIQDSIDEAILQDGKQEVENIRDEFERERQTIEQESTAAFTLLIKKKAELVKQIDDDTKKGLISPEIAKRKKFILTLVFGDLADQVEAAKATAQVELAYKQFQKLLDDITSRTSEKDVEAQEKLAQLVQDERDKLNKGAISRKKFEENVSEITRDAVRYRTNLRRLELEQQLRAINISLEASEDPVTKERLKKRQLKIREQLASLNIDSTKDVDKPKKVETVQQYAEAIGSLTQSIISFWQKANEAESAALDKSISLQEKRVEAAQRIAERGNAQYLKQEQDRLTQLNVQRENAARKQLGIDAALQASQLLVGITGAISKIASGIGAAETIAEIAIIVGALATGYGLVKSLQGNQPKLKTGTTYVQRGKHEAGEDTIPAWLSEGEAVIPEKKNKEYKKSVEAIYHGKIPADVLNEFVENYTSNKITKNIFNKDIKEVVNTSHVEKIVNNVVTKHLNDFITIHKIKDVPQVDYNRIKDAAELNINHDGKMSVLLTEHSNLLRENNELQRQILKKKILVEQHIDRNGVAAMVTDYITQKEIDRHS